MKIKFLTVITGLLMAAFMITSCLNDDDNEVTLSSESSITAFSIKDNIETKYTAKVNGKDTTLTATVKGSDYPFIIDQVERRIYNADSLPVGTNVSKVVVEITADTPYILIVADKDSLWTSTDSLNFENPVKFKVMAQSMEYGAVYTAEINVHKQEPDSLVWSNLSSDFNGSAIHTDQYAITTCDDNQSVNVALNINQLAQRKWQSDTDKQHGFQLEMNGKARSLATGPYKYNQWSLYNCKLILLRESEGVHGAETRNDTLDILKLTPDSLVLQSNRKNIPEKFHRTCTAAAQVWMN